MRLRESGIRSFPGRELQCSVKDGLGMKTGRGDCYMPMMGSEPS